MRYWEIDFFRGIAVVLMVLFNYSFALDFFGIYRITEGWLFWWLFPRLVGGAFIFLAGLSVAISYSRNRKWQKRAKRGARIFGWGVLITMITLLALPAGAVWFGVLHLIGLSIILSPLFVRYRKLSLALGAVLIIAGFYLENFTFGFPWLLWLGLAPHAFYTLDYFPLLPWFGIFLAGMHAGSALYANGKGRIKRRTPDIFRPLCVLGRNSLIIYLLHQPLLIAALYLLGLL